MVVINEAKKLLSHYAGMRSIETCMFGGKADTYRYRAYMKAEALMRGVCQVREPEELLALRADLMAHLMDCPNLKEYQQLRQVVQRADEVLADLGEKSQAYLRYSPPARAALARLRY